MSASNTNTAFKETLKQIEGGAECGGLPMISFLILPMQRVTRLPLLLDVSQTLLLHNATREQSAGKAVTLPELLRRLLSRPHMDVISTVTLRVSSFLSLSAQTICQKTPDKTAEYFAAVWALNAIGKVTTLRCCTFR